MNRDRLTRLVYGMALASGFAVAALGPAMPTLRDDLGISRTVGGLHFTALAVGAVVVGFTVESLTRAWGRRSVFWLGATGIAAGSLLVAVGGHPAVTIAGAFVVGTSGASMLSVGQAALSDRHPARRTVTLTEVHASTSLGSVLPGIILGVLVVVGVGWRPAVAAPVVAIAGLAIAGRAVSFPPMPGALETGRRMALPRPYWFFWAAFVPSVGAEWSIGAWGAGYLVDIAGTTAATAALLMVTYFGAIAIGRFIGARIARHVAPFPLLVGSTSLALIGFLAIVGSSSTALIVPGLFIAGVGISLGFPLLLTMAMGTVPDRPDEASARTFISAGASVAVAPLVLGAIADDIGLRGAFWLVPALLVLLLTLAGAGNRSEAQRSRDAPTPR